DLFIGKIETSQPPIQHQASIQPEEQAALINKSQGSPVSCLPSYSLIHNTSKQFTSIVSPLNRHSSSQQFRQVTSPLRQQKAIQTRHFIIRKQRQVREVGPTLKNEQFLKKTFNTKRGHKVKFFQEAGVLTAVVTEKVGSLSRKLHLPVYPQGLNLAEVLQEFSIHIALPEQAKDSKGYVYVGSMGLKGGGDEG
ncbi:hypothetical protein GR268_44100, partial [Rhizobium leguminosarum]|nr:hypothetical protein [Rhizobium leguminosarum]